MATSVHASAALNGTGAFATSRRSPSVGDVEYARAALGVRATRAQVAKYLGCHQGALALQVVSVGSSVSVAPARKPIAPPLPPPPRPRQAVNAVALQVIDDVASEAGLTREQLLSESRAKLLARARWCVFWRLKTQHGLGPKRIGRVFGLHHTSVIHGIQRHEAGLSA